MFTSRWLISELPAPLSVSQLHRAVSREQSRVPQGQGVWGLVIGTLVNSDSLWIIVCFALCGAQLYMHLKKVFLASVQFLTSSAFSLQVTVHFVALMYCVVSVEQTALTWPHFSYSHYVVLYSFMFNNNASNNWNGNNFVPQDVIWGLYKRKLPCQIHRNP